MIAFLPHLMTTYAVVLVYAVQCNTLWVAKHHYEAVRDADGVEVRTRSAIPCMMWDRWLVSFETEGWLGAGWVGEEDDSGAAMQDELSSAVIVNCLKMFPGASVICMMRA